MYIIKAIKFVHIRFFLTVYMLNTIHSFVKLLLVNNKLELSIIVNVCNWISIKKMVEYTLTWRAVQWT